MDGETKARRTRKPAALIAAEKRIEELEKSIKSKEQSYEYYQRQAAEYSDESDQLHAALDVFPGAPPRVVKTSARGYDQSVTLKPAARLMAWIASEYGRRTPLEF